MWRIQFYYLKFKKYLFLALSYSAEASLMQTPALQCFSSSATALCEIRILASLDLCERNVTRRCDGNAASLQTPQLFGNVCRVRLMK